MSPETAVIVGNICFLLGIWSVFALKNCLCFEYSVITSHLLLVIVAIRCWRMLSKLSGPPRGYLQPLASEKLNEYGSNNTFSQGTDCVKARVHNYIALFGEDPPVTPWTCFNSLSCVLLMQFVTLTLCQHAFVYLEIFNGPIPIATSDLYLPVIAAVLSFACHLVTMWVFQLDMLELYRNLQEAHSRSRFIKA